MASVISNNQITLDYLHHVNVDDISVDTVLELAKKVEEEFISKDKLLEEREKIIAEKQNETEQIEKELEEKDSALQDLKNKNQTLSEQLNTTSSDVEELKKERDRDRFIDKKMEENFDPLANKGIHLLVSIFVGFFLMYLAEIADEFDYKWAGIPYKYHKVFKMIGFLYPLILTIYNKEQTGQVFQFYFSKRSLKRKMEKRFSEEFDKQ
jgi:DNA-binding protein H-NS